MAKIYESQIEWKAPSAHRFQAAPLHDYISGALDNITQQTDRVSEGIQKLRDKDAADRMQLAAQAAQLYIDDFQDFSGDNYMEKMEAGAMKAWDEAFASLDTETQNRFMNNNPEARSIFGVKVKEQALEHTYDHENQAWTRQLPSIANEIVSLRDKGAIKQALADWVLRLTEGTGMRQKDATVAADKLQAMVAQGAIAMAIGSGRAQDANDLNNDLAFTALLTPEQRAQNRKAINSLINEQAKAAKETDAEKILTDKMVGSFEQFYNDLYRAAGQDEAAKEAALLEFNKFLNDFIEGNLKDRYGETPLAMLIPEGIVLTEVPRSIRQKIVKKTVQETLENDGLDKRLKDEIGFRATSKAAALENEDGTIDVSQVKLEDMADVSRILSQVQGYYGFDDKVQAKINKLHQAYTQYLDMAELSLQFSAFEDENTVIAERTGLGWRTERYARTGNITPATADALRSGAYKDTAQGTVYSNDYKVAMDAGIQSMAAWLNDGEMPESGTYKEMLFQEAVNYAKMPMEDKKALGIENVTNRQVVENLIQRAGHFNDLGLLNTEVGDTKTGVRPTAGSASLNNMSPASRQDVYKSMAGNSAFDEFLAGFRNEHFGLHMDAVEELEKTNGNISYKDVGKRWVKSQTLASIAPSSPSGAVEAISGSGKSGYIGITKEQIDKINKDWQEQVVKPVNSALVSDYAFRQSGGAENPVYSIVSALSVAPSSANAPRFPIADPIQDTPYYSSFIDGIKGLNNGAEPNSEIVASYSSANRATTYKGKADRVDRGRVSNSARKADKKTNAYKVPAGAAAYKIPVK